MERFTALCHGLWADGLLCDYLRCRWKMEGNPQAISKQRLEVLPDEHTKQGGSDPYIVTTNHSALTRIEPRVPIIDSGRSTLGKRREAMVR